jgi:hypothetical protein
MAMRIRYQVASSLDRVALRLEAGGETLLEEVPLLLLRG